MKLRPPFVVWPHLLRAVAVALAALSLAYGVASSRGLGAALAGAVAGAWVGHALARSRLRLATTLAAIALTGLLGAALARAALHFELVPALFGTRATLLWAGAARFASAAFVATGLLRAVAARLPAAAAVEVVAVAAAVPVAVAAHRDHVIARPLWLSDWSWRHDVDPTNVFLALGAVGAAALALLLLAEQKRRPASAFASLGALAMLAVVLVVHFGVPKPAPQSDLLAGSASGKASSGPPPGGSGRGGAGGSGSRPPGSGEPAGSGGAPQRPASSADGFGGQEVTSAGGSSGDVSARPASENLDEQGESNAGDAPMAVVLFDDDYAPPLDWYYFREQVLSEYNGRRLVRTTRDDVDRDVLDRFPSEPVEVRDAPGLIARTSVRATVALMTDHAHPFGLEAPVLFAPSPNPNPMRFVRAYRFESRSIDVPPRELLGRRAGDPHWGPDVRSAYLTGPADRRYQDLADSLVAKLSPEQQRDPFARAVAVKLYLDKTMVYSIRATHVGESDPAGELLFGNHVGYCVHFANAAALLYRAVGVPSRVASGYAFKEGDRHGGSVVVLLGQDAHAWPEIYLDGVGWVPLDISAAKTLDPSHPPHDPALQSMLGDMARKMPPPGAAGELPDPFDPAFWRAARRLALGGLGAALAALYFVKLWRRVAPHVAVESSLPRVGYRAALDALADAGRARREGESREAFARRVRDEAPSFEALTYLHLEGRLGDPRRLAPGRGPWSRREWGGALAALRREIGRNSRRWRRAIGLIDPTSFLRSR